MFGVHARDTCHNHFTERNVASGVMKVTHCSVHPSNIATDLMAFGIRLK